jgi:kumamolisin
MAKFPKARSKASKTTRTTKKTTGETKRAAVAAPTARFSEQARTVLPGSEKAAAAEAAHVRATPPGAKLTVSVIVKRREPLKMTRRGGLSAGPVRVSRAEFQRRHGADPEAMKQVRGFAREFGLKVEADATASLRRTVKLTGTAGAMQKAFGVALEQKTIEGAEYRVREGGIRLPASLLEHVEAVLGLDNRPQAKPHYRVRGTLAAAASGAASGPKSYTPPQVAEAYQFPAKASGAGETIGILELGGGYRTADLAAYFKGLGLTAPAITAVAVNGGKNAPSKPSSADTEVMLDIEVAASVAPGAKVAVYFAPNTDQGFIDAISTAVHDQANKPGVLSISWGGPETSWTAQGMQALDAACQSAAALGVTITVAAGDNGSSDGGKGNNADFPGTSPHVLCCGGTKLEASGAAIASEVVWNEQAIGDGATGGGVSTVFALPAWQANAKVPKAAASAGGRGVPDVAGDADPNTGYTVRVDGENTVVGGTSAVAPLWAGLVAVANAQLGTQVGFLQPVLYAAKAASAFNDITVGNNGAFAAGPGWDACTGLGSPIAGKLIALLGAAGAGKSAAKKGKAGKGKPVGKKAPGKKPVAKKGKPAGKKKAIRRRG